MKSNYPDVERKLRLALAMILNGAPFDASILMTLKMSEDESIPTAMTDCATFLKYNPIWFNQLTPESIAAVLAHEAAHKWMMHGFRGQGKNPMVYNIAADFVLNAELNRRNFKFGPELGKRSTVDEMVRSWKNEQYDVGFAFDNSLDVEATTEGVYDMLIPYAPPDDKCGGPGQGTLDGMGKPDAGNSDANEQAVGLDIIQAAATAKAMGKLSAHAQRIVGELENPVEDWRKLLRRFFNRARDMRRSQDTGYHRPSRRMQPGMPAILPARRYEPYGEYVVTIDTSGSITDEDLANYEAQTRAIMEQIRPKAIHVIYCDSEIDEVVTFREGEPVKFTPHGGGGTDFNPPLKWVAEHKIVPVAFLYFTDGYGSFPDKPSYPFLWAMTTDVEAPWGQIVRLPQ